MAPLSKHAIWSVPSSFPVEGAAALGFRHAFYYVQRACNDAVSDLLLCQGGAMCHCVAAKLVGSRFTKDRDVRNK